MEYKNTRGNYPPRRESLKQVSKNTCKECGKAFCDKSTLNRHVKSFHMKQKVNAPCNKSLTSGNLARHVAGCSTCKNLKS